MTVLTESERRAAERHRLPELTVAVQMFLDVLVISTGGLGVRMPAAPAVGSHHRLTIDIGGEALDVDAVVRNLHEEGAGTFEVGLEFVDLSPRAKRVIAAFVEERDR